MPALDERRAPVQVVFVRLPAGAPPQPGEPPAPGPRRGARQGRPP